MMHPNPDEYRDELEAASKLFDSGQYGLAFAKYLPLAEGGSIGAQLRVGWMYHSGRGVGHDVEQARRWYIRAAEASSAEAQFYLGRLSWTEQRYQETIEMFERSASQNYGPALYQLGVMYLIGEGVKPDEHRAYRYFEKAAHLGHLFAQREMALRMIKGHDGVIGVFRGIFAFVRIVAAGLRLGARDPYSDLIRK